MTTYILFDDLLRRKKLHAIVANKSIASLRLGLLSIKEKWDKGLDAKIEILVPSFLQEKYAFSKNIPAKHQEVIYINSAYLPNENFIKAINNLKEGILLYQNEIIASTENPYCIDAKNKINEQVIHEPCLAIEHLWRITQLQKKYFEEEFAFFISQNHSLQNLQIPLNTMVLGDINNIYLGKNVITAGAVLDAREGKIILDDNVFIMPNSVLSGNVFLGKNTTAKIGTQIYGTTIVGENCTLGGEIKNCAIGNYTNKAHYGYIGDAYIGDWCNLGAGTTASNFKNTASDIHIHQQHFPIDNIGKKGACIIGDYSKTGIGTYLNTASIINICSHIIHPKTSQKEFAPFYWGENEKYNLQKAFQHIENWMQLKNKTLSEIEKKIITHLYNNDATN